MQGEAVFNDFCGKLKDLDRHAKSVAMEEKEKTLLNMRTNRGILTARVKLDSHADMENLQKWKKEGKSLCKSLRRE